MAESIRKDYSSKFAFGNYGSVMFFLCTCILFDYYFYSIQQQHNSNSNKKILVYLTSYEEQQTQTKPKCQPKNHIMYSKTHKTASTSIANIFLRYGHKNNLFLALPLKSNLWIAKDARLNLKKKDISIPSDALADIFTLHFILNITALSKLIHNDSIWITILREPASRYISQFYFRNLQRKYNQSLEEIMQSNTCEELQNMLIIGGRLNRMSRDLGLDPSLEKNLNLKSEMDKLDSIFDLVLIFEKLEESLILLKEKLCWTFEDVVILLEMRHSKNKKEVSKKVKEKIRECNKADVFLYSYFLDKHNREVEKFGRLKMESEIAILRKEVDRLSNFCQHINSKTVSKIYFSYDFCIFSKLLPERTIPMLKMKQRRRNNKRFT